MRILLLIFCTLPLCAQNYATFSNQPVARLSFLGHQSFLHQNAFNDTSLIGFWRLNEGVGRIAFDSSGNSNNGTWGGSPGGANGYYSAGKTAPWAGVFTGAALNLVNGFATSVSPPATSRTACAWINPTLTSNEQGIIGTRGSTGGGWVLELVPGGNLSYFHTGEVGIMSSTTVPSGAWSFVCATLSVPNAALYINGSSAGVSSSFVVDTTTNSNGAIGSQGGSPTRFNGLIANARIYNRALTQAEIQTIYNAENH